MEQIGCTAEPKILKPVRQITDFPRHNNVRRELQPPAMARHVHLRRGQLLQRHDRLHAGALLPARGREEGLRALRVRPRLRHLRAHRLPRQPRHWRQSQQDGNEGCEI